MRYELDPFSFELPEDFRDDTDYSFAAPQATDTVRFTLLWDASDAGAILKTTESALRALYGSLLVYLNATSVRRGDLVTAPALEGAILNGARQHRIAVIALTPGQPPCAAFYTTTQGDFRRRFDSIASRISMFDESSLAPPTELHAHRVGSFAFMVPPRWTQPRTYLFCSRATDSVRIRVTTESGAVDARDISLVEEIPLSASEPHNVLSEEFRYLPGSGSEARWLVVQPTRLGDAVTCVRHASVPLQDGRSLNIYGRASADDASPLDRAFVRLLTSLSHRG